MNSWLKTFGELGGAQTLLCRDPWASERLAGPEGHPRSPLRPFPAPAGARSARPALSKDRARLTRDARAWR